MSQYLLAPGVHLCTIDGGAMLLSLRSNQYIGVNAEDFSVLACSLHGLSYAAPRESGESARTDVLDILVARGFLTRESQPGRPFVPLNICASCALPPGQRRTGAIRIRALDAYQFMCALMFVATNLRRSRLDLIIEHLERLKHASVKSVPSKSLIDALAIFRRLRALSYTAHNRCLFDSLVLTEFLLRLGHRPIFVIGVKTKPFLAHAWVQSDDCVLDETTEKVQQLTPMLAV